VTTPPDSTPALDPLDAIIASYTQAVERGQAPDRQALPDRHPDLADALRAFFSDFDRMGRLVSPLRLAGGLDETGTPEPSGRVALPIVRYFGDYELQQEVARGGMGVVYKARQVSLNRVVALKMILAGAFASAREVQRFRAEAEAAANLDHPHIVPIFEVGEHEGQQYYSMKFVEGTSLARHPRGRAHEEVGGLIAVARAVHHAHQHGVLHRDLKPSNVLVDLQGTWFVTDFGLAKRLADSGGTFTESGQVLGTPRYMAPEQAAGRKDLTVAADVYSLGVILYERLTGRTPFGGPDLLTLLRRVREAEPPRPSSIEPGLDRDLETVVVKCLEKEAGRRYASADALADDLDRWRTGRPISARPTDAVSRAWKWARRNPAVAMLSASVGLLLLLTTVVSTLAAVRQTALARLAQGLYLAAQSELIRPSNPGLALALALEAAERHPGPTTNDSVLTALEANYELRTLEHAGRVTHASISPDGRRVATADGGSEQGGPAVRLWDVESGRPLAVLAHDGTVGAARFTPDGRRLVTFSSLILNNPSFLGAVVDERISPQWDLRVRVWDIGTGRLLAEHVERVRGEISWRINASQSMDMSPDGRRVVVTGGLYPGHPPRIIDLDGARVHATLEGHEAPVVAVAFSPDGRRVATASADRSARIWDAENGRELRRQEGGEGPTRFLAYSPDSRLLVMLRDTGPDAPGLSAPERLDSIIGRIWDVETGNGLATLRWPKVRVPVSPGQSYETEQHADCLVARFSTDGSEIYTIPAFAAKVSENRHPAVWSARTGAFRRSLKRDGRGNDDATDLVISADGRKIAIGYADGSIRLLDPSAGRIRALDGHSRGVTSLAFTPDGRRLVSTADDRTARVWDARTGNEVEFTRRIWPDVQQVVFNPEGDLIATEVDLPPAHSQSPQWDRFIEFREVSRGTIVSRTNARLDGSFSPEELGFSPDGRTFYASSPRGCIPFEVASGRQLAPIGPTNPRNGGLGRALSPDGRTVAVADGDLYLYETSTGRALVRIAGTSAGTDSHPIKKVRFSPDGEMLLTTGDSESARLWSRRDGRLLAVFQHADEAFPTTTERITAAEFGRDGRRLVTSGSSNLVRIWDVKTKRQALALRAPRGPIDAAVFSPDGDRVMTAGRDGLAIIWDARTGRELGRIAGHDGIQIHAVFSPDGKAVLTYGLDRTARLWDGGTGQPICTLVRQEESIFSGGFSPDGRFVVLSFNGVPRLTRSWPVDFLAAARACRPRDLTPEERVRFALSTR
jgi:WD40 repeat protein